MFARTEHDAHPGALLDALLGTTDCLAWVSAAAAGQRRGRRRSGLSWCSTR
ncbi:hypothetical protein ACFY15_35000 [Streptomyces sp. NPDC001373]|uniref:hypothetical protein n=1 Tax=Streptomyces sp. NPDC001373 TaxID=3364565 RepID=UPI003678138E